MRERYAAFGLVLLLAGCGAAASPTATPTAAPVVTPVPTPTAFVATDESSAIAAMLQNEYKTSLTQVGYSDVAISSESCIEQAATQSYTCQVLFSATSYGTHHNYSAQVPGVCDSTGVCNYLSSTNVAVVTP
jgi:hypothetical protein